VVEIIEVDEQEVEMMEVDKEGKNKAWQNNNFIYSNKYKMKKIFILLLSTLFLISCWDKNNVEIGNEKINNIWGEQKEMLSSPNGWGNTGSLKNDSFRK